MGRATINGVKGNIRTSTRNGKKWMFVPDDENKKTVHAGQAGETIQPGSPAGNNYCARSNGIPHGKQGKVTPNDLARYMWRCEGKRSVANKAPKVD